MATIVLNSTEQINAARFLAVVKGIEFEVKTGMKMTRGRSCLSIAREEGWTIARTNKSALPGLIAMRDELLGR